MVPSGKLAPGAKLLVKDNGVRQLSGSEAVGAVQLTLAVQPAALTGTEIFEGHPEITGAAFPSSFSLMPQNEFVPVPYPSTCK